MEKTKSQIGKASRQAGLRFEVKVRKDLESNGWIVDRWSNNVDLENNKLIPAKPKFVYNPKLKMRVPMGMNSGFPDFICFKPNIFKDIKQLKYLENYYEIAGVESKMNGKLDKIEKQKCQWLLENNVFSKILIASKGEVRGSIKYEKFERR